MRLTGRDSDEVWLPTCFTVVRAANAVATPNAAANAANAMRRRMTCSDVIRNYLEAAVATSGETSPSSQSCSSARAFHACAIRE